MISTMAMEFSVFTGTGTPAETRASTMIPAKLSEANALFRNPDRVMATWMVARKRAGLFGENGQFFCPLVAVVHETFQFRLIHGDYCDLGACEDRVQKCKNNN